MSASMEIQRGRVQLEQSDMRLALNMAKIATECCPCAAIQETKYLIQKPRAVGPRRKEAGVSVSWADKGEGCNTKTRGNASSKPNVRLASLPTWHHTESTDTLDTHSTRCASTRPTQRADSRADSTPARQASHPNRYHFRSSTC
jgi:hypothetical protein